MNDMFVVLLSSYLQKKKLLKKLRRKAKQKKNRKNKDNRGYPELCER